VTAADSLTPLLANLIARYVLPPMVLLEMWNEIFSEKKITKMS